MFLPLAEVRLYPDIERWDCMAAYLVLVARALCV